MSLQDVSEDHQGRPTDVQELVSSSPSTRLFPDCSPIRYTPYPCSEHLHLHDPAIKPKSDQCEACPKTSTHSSTLCPHRRMPSFSSATPSVTQDVKITCNTAEDEEFLMTSTPVNKRYRQYEVPEEVTKKKVCESVRSESKLFKRWYLPLEQVDVPDTNTYKLDLPRIHNSNSFVQNKISSSETRDKSSGGIQAPHTSVLSIDQLLSKDTRSGQPKKSRTDLLKRFNSVDDAKSDDAPLKCFTGEEQHSKEDDDVTRLGDVEQPLDLCVKTFNKRPFNSLLDSSSVTSTVHFQSPKQTVQSNSRSAGDSLLVEGASEYTIINDSNNNNSTNNIGSPFWIGSQFEHYKKHYLDNTSRLYESPIPKYTPNTYLNENPSYLHESPTTSNSSTTYLRDNSLSFYESPVPKFPPTSYLTEFETQYARSDRSFYLNKDTLKRPSVPQYNDTHKRPLDPLYSDTLRRPSDPHYSDTLKHRSVPQYKDTLIRPSDLQYQNSLIRPSDRHYHTETLPRPPVPQYSDTVKRPVPHYAPTSYLPTMPGAYSSPTPPMTPKSNLHLNTYNNKTLGSFPWTPGFPSHAVISGSSNIPCSTDINNCEGSSKKRNKNHQCSVCQKCFPRFANLTRHMRTHTGEQPYKCSQCERCFSISSNMRRHERKVHGIETAEPVDKGLSGSGDQGGSGIWSSLKCPVCGDVLVDEAALEVHLGQHKLLLVDRGDSASESDSDDTLLDVDYTNEQSLELGYSPDVGLKRVASGN